MGSYADDRLGKVTRIINNVAVRDTATITQATGADIHQPPDYNFLVQSTLDQAVNVQYQWSPDGTTWFNMGSAVNVALNSGLTAPALPFKPMAGFVRANLTAAVAPTTGNLSAWWAITGAT